MFYLSLFLDAACRLVPRLPVDSGIALPRTSSEDARSGDSTWFDRLSSTLLSHAALTTALRVCFFVDFQFYCPFNCCDLLSAYRSECRLMIHAVNERSDIPSNTSDIHPSVSRQAEPCVQLNWGGWWHFCPWVGLRSTVALSRGRGLFISYFGEKRQTNDRERAWTS